MRTIDLLKATLGALTALCISASPITVATQPSVQDCFPYGPDTNYIGSNSPVFMDMGSTASANEEGCNGCNISWDIMVIWQHTGEATIVDWDGDVFDTKVLLGEVDYFDGFDFLDCDDTSNMDFAGPNCSMGVWFYCSVCR